jgi:hypothetical protein
MILTKDNEMIRRRLFTMLLVVACIVVCMCACRTARTYAELDAAHQSWFDACIEQHPSDAVCDSCWHAITGRH